MINTLDVYLWNRKVGTLIAGKKGHKEEFCFYYDSDFIRGNLDIAPLKASIHSNSVRNGFPVYPDGEKIFGGLPSFIADSLPDYWGATVFREWAANAGVNMKRLNALDRLAYIGSRGMGALEFRPPAAPEFDSPFKVQIESLYAMARKTLADAKKFSIKLSSDLQIENLFKVGTSAGGRRPKAILNINMQTGVCFSGQTDAPEEGFTPVIIKFDEKQSLALTRIEYSYYLLARAVGLNMMPSHLLEIGDATHFITERFDRKEGEKLHIQTLVAMNPLADSYEDLLEVAMKLNLPKSALHQIFSAMIMNVIFGNVDDHNKNFSFIMDANGIWSFAPVYDFTFTLDPEAPEYINRHSLSINGKTDGISIKDFLEVAKRFDINNPEGIIGIALKAKDEYPSYALSAGVPEEQISLLRSCFPALRD